AVPQLRLGCAQGRASASRRAERAPRQRAPRGNLEPPRRQVFRHGGIGDTPTGPRRAGKLPPRIAPALSEAPPMISSRTPRSRRGRTCVLALGLAALAVHQASAQDKEIELRLSSAFGVQHPHHKNVLLPWSKLIEQRSHGRLKVVIYPDGILGKARDQ